ncbi:MAG TPA: CFI-box-CTERM domain-containing protein [Candidatus Nitrosotenuis sp.]|nr:CFI-box-CTERM domain-containing protein [Candidatus Nitrosotenuis sp.]
MNKQIILLSGLIVVLFSSPIISLAEFSRESCQICISQSGGEGYGYNQATGICEKIDTTYWESNSSPATPHNKMLIVIPNENRKQELVKINKLFTEFPSCEKPSQITADDMRVYEIAQQCFACAIDVSRASGWNLKTDKCERGSPTGSFESDAKGSDKNWVWFSRESIRLANFKAGNIVYDSTLACNMLTKEIIDSAKPSFNPIETVQEVTSVGKEAGCLIATATYGTELAPQVQSLRELRNSVLLNTNSGITFMSGFNQFYYSFSPAVADLERQNPIFKEVVKTAITPMLSTLSILNYVDIDSEQEVLGYGIGIILLNISIYFVMPAIIILKIKSALSHKSQ